VIDALTSGGSTLQVLFLESGAEEPVLFGYANVVYRGEGEYMGEIRAEDRRGDVTLRVYLEDQLLPQQVMPPACAIHITTPGR
jgi:hypothetical protein